MSSLSVSDKSASSELVLDAGLTGQSEATQSMVSCAKEERLSSSTVHESHDRIDCIQDNKDLSRKSRTKHRSEYRDAYKDVRYEVQLSKTDRRDKYSTHEQLYRDKQIHGQSESPGDFRDYESRSQGRKTGHVVESTSSSSQPRSSSAYLYQSDSSALDSERYAKGPRGADKDRHGGHRSECDKTACSVVSMKSDLKPLDYQPILTRHVNQLFLRGDNVVMVALAD